MTCYVQTNGIPHVNVTFVLGQVIFHLSNRARLINRQLVAINSKCSYRPLVPISSSTIGPRLLAGQ